MATIENLICELYTIVQKLEKKYPGRHFTPDGHLVGSIGECLIAEQFDLDLVAASNKGFDAVSKCKKEVEIKVTQSNRVAFRHEPQHAIVGKLSKKGQVSIVYNGPGNKIWEKFDGKNLPSNGQYQISLNVLKQLNENVNDSERVKK